MAVSKSKSGTESTENTLRKSKAREVMMKQRDGRFTGARGHSLYFRYWEPDQQARAIILLVHGGGEHCQRYQHFAEYFCSRGFIVAGMDLIGHGKSDGEYGFFERFDDHIESLENYRQQVERDFPSLPMILFGHSMGGLLSSLFLLDHQQYFIGCALSGPAINTDSPPPSIQVLLIRLLSRLLPKVGVWQLDTELLSRDQSVVDDYWADPLVSHGKISARMLAELFTGAQRIQAQAEQITLPLLLLHGGGDMVTAPSGSQFLYDQVSSELKSLKIYPGLYHEILHEPEHKEVFIDLLGWCEERLAAA